MAGTVPVQLSLGIALNDEATFANFYSDDANAQVIEALTNRVAGDGDTNLLIWGAPGVGLTHLLQAVCHDVYACRQTVQYLPLRDMVGFSASDVCEGLEEFQFVCLDDIDHVCGIREWEQALFHLYNKLRDAGHVLLIASHTSPPSLPVVLADLKSRILGSMRYHVKSLSDSGKQSALIMRAGARGMEMSVEVVQYILNRTSRNTGELFDLLDRLDDESMQRKRKLTVPFVKEVLGW